MPLTSQRFFALSAHRLRTFGKHLIYLLGCLTFKPIILIRRRLLGTEIMPGRILYVCLAQRGDFILALPVLAEIKRHFPQSHITCWVRGFNRRLTDLNSAVDQVLVYDGFSPSGAGAITELMRIRRHRSLLQKLRDGGFTLLIDDSGAGFTSLMGALARIPTRIGRNSQGYGFLNHFDFAADSNGQLLQKRLKLLQPLGIAPRDCQTVRNAIAVGDSLSTRCRERYGLRRHGYLTVQPIGGWRAKSWPASHVTVFVSGISRQTGLLPVLLGAAGERDDLESIGANSDVGYLNLAGELELDELAAVIADSAIHFGIDSVGSHMACALGTKSLTIFGPTNPRISHSFSRDNIAVFKRTSCTPKPDEQYCCFDAGRTCPVQANMGELRAEEVLPIALELLNSKNQLSLYEL